MTEMLYYIYPEQEEFQAEVMESVKQGKMWRVVLDKSCFYPEGGGQPADHGWFRDIPVIDVQKENHTIYHFTKNDPGLGNIITGKVDMNRRFDYMQQHTGQHLVSGALWQVGQHKTVSVHMGLEYTTIEIESPFISQEQLTEVENIVNRIIREDLPVKAIKTTDQELNRFPLRKIPDRQGDIRLVQMGDFDCVACGGLHLKRTGLVQLVKVTATEAIRGNTRITWKMGDRALEDYRLKHNVTSALKPLLAVGEYEFLTKTQRLLKDLDQSIKEKNILQSRLADMVAGQLLQNGKPATNNGPIVITASWHNEEDQLLKKIMKNLLKSENLLVCLVNISGGRFRWSIGCSATVDFPFNKLREKLFTISGGKGGGRHPLWQGSGSQPQRIGDFFSLLLTL